MLLDLSQAAYPVVKLSATQDLWEGHMWRMDGSAGLCTGLKRDCHEQGGQKKHREYQMIGCGGGLLGNHMQWKNSFQAKRPAGEGEENKE